MRWLYCNVTLWGFPYFFLKTQGHEISFNILYLIILTVDGDLGLPRCAPLRPAPSSDTRRIASWRVTELEGESESGSASALGRTRLFASRHTAMQALAPEPAPAFRANAL